jgi:quinoprotein glucose dehydrogenase
MKIQAILQAASATAAFMAVLNAQPPAAKTVWDGVYTKEQAQRGESLYKENCASCHGAMMEGIEMAPALVGGDFIDQWAGQTMGDLFERIRATMPRDKPGRLSREVDADITAYMLSYNRFPAGAAELSHDTQALSQIRIQAVKPE